MIPDDAVPLFPLPNVLLYPGAVLPLHVFEPRYVKLVEDLQASGSPWLALGLLRRGWEDDYFGQPPIHEIAGVGRLVQSQQAGGGRWNVLVEGVQRVRLAEVPSDRLYRQVRVERLTEIPVPDQDHAAELTGQLRALLSELAAEEVSPNLDGGPAYLADLLLVALAIGMEEKVEIFAELDIESRAQQVMSQAREELEVNRALRAADAGGADGRWN